MIDFILSFFLDMALPGVILGAIAFCAAYFIPVSYRVPTQALAVVLIAGGVFFLGRDMERKEWQLKVAEVELRNQWLEAQGERITENTVVVYKDRIKTIEKEGKVIYVDRYISKEDDNKCVIPDGFVRLHNDSVDAKVSETPTGINGTPTQIKLSEVGKTVNGNYLTYNQIAERLISLQDWVRKQEELHNKGKPAWQSNSQQP